MADAIAVGAILNAASLKLRNHLGNVHSNGAELGVRHQATGTKDLTNTANLGHHGGESDSSVEVNLALLDVGNQLVGTNNVGTGLTSLVSLSTLSKHSNTNSLAGAVRQGDGTADVLVGLTSIDAQTEVSLNSLVKVSASDFLSQLHSLCGRVELSAVDLLRSGAVLLTVLCHINYLLWSNGHVPSHNQRVPNCTQTGATVVTPEITKRKSLLGDGNAHGAGGAGDDLLSGINVVSIEVRHLDLSDLGELLLSKLTNLVGLGLSGTALELELLLDQVSCRRSLADKGERAILVHRNLNRDDVTLLVLRSGIERLAELHDVDLSSTQCRANGRSGVSSASRNLELNDGGNFLLSHVKTFLKHECVYSANMFSANPLEAIHR